MASNYTTNYNLCQWQPTDQVQRTDFNADNAKIDAALAAKAEQSDLDALESAVELKAAQSALNAAIATIPKVAVGTYTGDGAVSRKISLSFTPKAVFVNPVSGKTYDFYDNHQYHGGLAVQGGPLKWENSSYGDVKFLEIVSGGFTVSTQTSSNQRSQTNDSGRTYYYLAIG